eukprot:scaffold33282_cov19-Tisochrysis_lutea.AAC.2
MDQARVQCRWQIKGKCSLAKWPLGMVPWTQLFWPSRSLTALAAPGITVRVCLYHFTQCNQGLYNYQFSRCDQGQV